MASHSAMTAGTFSYDPRRLLTMSCSIFPPRPFTSTTHSPRTVITHRPGPCGSTVTVPCTTHRSLMLFVVWKCWVNGAVRCDPSRHRLRSMNSTRLFPKMARRSAQGMAMFGIVLVTVRRSPSTVSSERYSFAVPFFSQWKALYAALSLTRRYSSASIGSSTTTSKTTMAPCVSPHARYPHPRRRLARRSL